MLTDLEKAKRQTAHFNKFKNAGITKIAHNQTHGFIADFTESLDMKNTLALIMVLCCFLSGCSTLNMFATEVHVAPEIVEAMHEAQTFVGKTKQDVLSRYGEPGDIRFNVGRNSTVREESEYDDAWYYKYDAGIPLVAPNQYSIDFYFIGDIVKLVTG